MNNYFVSKAVGIYIMVFLIPVIHYTYTAFMKGNLIIDIGSFFAAVIIGQIASFFLFNRTKKSRLQQYTAITTLVILGTLFVVFTFYPPHIDMFVDPITCTYGISKTP
jgi:heme/copper-type cytochrome/quinol oxidase subunit 4